MESVSTFVDKSNGKIYLLIRYSFPPLKLHESYTKGRRMTMDDFRMLSEGMKNGIVCHGTQEYCEALKAGMLATAERANEELEYYKLNGEFSNDEFKKFHNDAMDRQKTITMFTDILSNIKDGIEKMESFMKEGQLRIVPKVRENFEGVLKMTPEAFAKLNAIQYNGIITLNGQVIPKTSDVVNGMFLGSFDVSNLFINKVILRMFLRFYMETYDFRSQFFGKLKTTTLEVDDLIISMDSKMRIIMDLTCPRMVSIRNSESPLDLNLDVTLRNSSFGISFRGKEIVNIDIPVSTDPVSEIKIDSPPNYLTTIRRKYWVDECMLILNIILCLILKDRNTQEPKLRNVISLLGERILIILNEGVVPDKSKIQELVEGVYISCNVTKPETDALTLLTSVLEIILSGEQDEIKENFSVEVRRILEEVLTGEDN